VVESLKNLVRCCHRSTSIAPSRDCVSIGGPVSRARIHAD
jgi:hypothetical protein